MMLALVKIKFNQDFNFTKVCIDFALERWILKVS